MPPESKYAKGIVKREKILTVAMDLIARDGYNSATIRQLAEAVGLSKTGVVHHFGTKEELFVELLRRRDVFRPGPPDDLPPTEVVDAVLGKIEEGLDAPGLVELHVRFGAEASAPDHPAHDFFADRYTALDELGARTFDGMRAAGRLAPGADPATLAVLFAAVVDGLQMRSLFTGDLDVMGHLSHLFEIVSAQPHHHEKGATMTETHEDPTTERVFPVPTSVSEQAQQWLAMPTQTTVYPALDDTAGWLALIDRQDATIRSMFAAHFLPVTTQKTEFSGVPTYVLRADGIADDDTGPVFLTFHGGGLITGGGELSALLTSGTALTSGMTTWSVDYRMPPLHPYPAALDDGMAVYRALLEQRDPADVVVGGGSAGGNLAAALLLRAKDEGLPMPAALVLTTPEVDLTESGDSFQINRDADHILSSLIEANTLYAGGHDLTDPYLSPLFGDLTGFPPTFLQTGTRDLFLSNTVRMHRKLRNAGVEAELHVFEAMTHGGFGGASPEDADAAAELRRFLDRHRR